MQHKAAVVTKKQQEANTNKCARKSCALKAAVDCKWYARTPQMSIDIADKHSQTSDLAYGFQSIV